MPGSIVLFCWSVERHIIGAAAVLIQLQDYLSVGRGWLITSHPELNEVSVTPGRSIADQVEERLLLGRPDPEGHAEIVRAELCDGVAEGDERAVGAVKGDGAASDETWHSRDVDEGPVHSTDGVERRGPGRLVELPVMGQSGHGRRDGHRRGAEHHNPQINRPIAHSPDRQISTGSLRK